MQDAPAQHEKRQSIRRYLLLRILALVVAAVFGFLGVAYVLVLRPAQEELARVEMTRAAGAVEGEVRALIAQIERVLGTAREWGKADLYRFDRPQEFARLLIPVIDIRPQISAILIADADGRSLQINRVRDGGGWLIRDTDVARLGTRQRHITLSASGAPVSETTVEVGYDPRTRPWHIGAMALKGEYEVHWTAPYQFFGRSDIGMSASMRWADRASGAPRIVMFDVLLADLSNYSSKVTVARNGRAAILSEDGRMLGLPRDTQGRTAAELENLVFKTVHEAGFPVLAAVYEQWVADGRPESRATNVALDGEDRIARLAPLAVGDQRLIIASFAPRSDFQVGTLRDAAALGVLLLAAVALAFFLARRLSQRFGGILGQLLHSSERIGALDLDAPVRIDTPVRELARLVDAQERMRVLLLDATRGLEAKVAERTGELHAANAEQDAIFQSATSGIALIKDRVILRCNRKLEEIFGCDKGELPGKSTRRWYASEEEYQRGGSEVYETLARGGTHRREQRLVRKDGSQFWCRLVGVAVNPAQLEQGTVWMLDDVTEERAAADALLEAKRVAEEATHAKSAFLASMSHEIRTPMNGVLGMLQLLALTRLDAEQKGSLDAARDSAKSLLRIIDDLLDFSKIEAGKLEIHPEVTSLAAVVESVRQVYSGVASAKDLALGATVDPAISPAVRVDALRLRQILNNFVSNAIKFTARGSVQITATRMEHGESREVVRFAVTDTGIGISQEGQARLFQPYVQAAADTARQYGGTGLGLTICLRLAGLMGGAIAMQSELGKGTTMSFTLPLPVADPRDLPRTEGANEAAAALVASRRKAPTVEAARAEGTLVLMAEDHPTNRHLLTRLLNLLGYAVVTANHGREALEKWEAGRFGALVTDCNMPEMDGYQLAQAIRAREASAGRARMPIIACTANAFAEELQRCTAAGMDDFLAKPVELAALAKAMERWLPVPGAARGAAAPAAPTAPKPAQGFKQGNGAPLDRSSLAQISGGDAAMEREILADFKSANDTDMQELRQALAQRDLKQITHASHRVKGACRMVGATALASVCERMEKAGRPTRNRRKHADRRPAPARRRGSRVPAQDAGAHADGHGREEGERSGRRQDRALHLHQPRRAADRHHHQ